jgi:hypothetical protein
MHGLSMSGFVGRCEDHRRPDGEDRADDEPWQGQARGGKAIAMPVAAAPA